MKRCALRGGRVPESRGGVEGPEGEAEQRGPGGPVRALQADHRGGYYHRAPWDARLCREEEMGRVELQKRSVQRRSNERLY